MGSLVHSRLNFNDLNKGRVKKILQHLHVQHIRVPQTPQKTCVNSGALGEKVVPVLLY